MILKMFAVFDTKAAAFMTPFFSQNVGLALRSFTHMARDPNSYMHAFPADFILFELGEFDGDAGVINPHERPVNHGMASAYLPKEE